MTLAGIGIQTEPERVYRFVLARQGCLPSDVSAGLGLTSDAVGGALRILADAELVRAVPGRGLSAIDPAIGVERLVEERLGRLNEELRAAAAVRTAVSELTALRNRVESVASPVDVEKMDGAEDVRRRLAELAFAAHRDVLALQPGAMPGHEARQAVRSPDPRGLRPGVALRTVVHAEAVADRGVADHLLELLDAGAAIRATDHPMDWMIVFDGAVVALPYGLGALGARGAVIVHQPGLAASMAGLFEQVWDRATDLRSLVGGSVTTPSALDRQVLRLLMETDTDEAGARRLHVSLRTYRRYVARLLNRLGAANRFQAAARAKDLHWI